MGGQTSVVWLSLSMNLSLKPGLALAFASGVCNNGPISVALVEPLRCSVERQKIKRVYKNCYITLILDSFKYFQQYLLH